jgi:ATP-dependent DNA helicase RecG
LFHHFLGPDDLVWLRHLTNEPISDEESRALVFVRELGAIDNAAYRSINRTDTLNASSHLRRLRDLQLLDMKGSGSRTYYVPGSQFVATPVTAELNTPQPLKNSHQPTQNSHQPAQNSHQSPALVPADLQAKIPPAGSKPRREVLRAVITDLCRWQDLSARELAALLHRKEHKPLVRDYLSPMVAEGVLAYTIPEMEKHPDQRYTVPGAMPAQDEVAKETTK